MNTGVDIIGSLPERGERARVFLLYANTKTERKLLQSFVDEVNGDLKGAAKPYVAWFSDTRAHDHFEHEGLLDALAQTPSLDIIPIGVIWRPKSDERLSWLQTMSWMRMLESNIRQQSVLKRHPDRCAIVIGEFGTQKALIARYHHMATSQGLTPEDDPAAFAQYVSLQAGITLERDSRVATGQTVKYPRYVHRAIWGRPDFQARLAELAKESGEDLATVQDEARGCMKELIPRVSAPYVSLTSVVGRNISRLGYDQEFVYDKDKMSEIRKLALTRPVALVWTHKTHMDGFALMLTTQEEHFPLVHVVGGNNMAFFGIGSLMRRSGTIFIRRSMSSAVYKIILRYYLAFLLEKRFPISWALEGTRSRNGKLMPPRFGILKYVVEAAEKGEMKDLTIVPVSIYYDLIAELGDYAKEQTGATKRKESFAWFTGYLRSLRKPLGRISLGLGDPVVVDTTAERFVTAREEGQSSLSIELQKLAFEASVNVNAVTPITPSSLICLALTGAAPQALTAEELVDQVWRLRDWALDREYAMTDELKNSDPKRVQEIVESMIEIDLLDRYDEGPDTVYSIAHGKHFEASYYRNNSIHFFVNQAIIELALAKAKDVSAAGALEAFWSEVVALRDTFKFEFYYPELDQYKNDIVAELDRHDIGWKSTISSGGAEALLKEVSPLVSHAVLRPFAEAYSVVSDVLLGLDAGPIDEKTVVNKALKLGRQSFLQRRISSEESIGKLMFSNGFQLAKNRGLVPENAIDMKAARKSFVREIDDVVRRLRLVGDIASQQRRDAKVGYDAGSNDDSVLTVVGEN
ncbi:MAG: 1-acyl-sn-glycerol-3-phosphate acyltransferase [Pseudomonadota bacterium]